jgi:SOS-response transcriptional repressor LexA
MRNFGKRLKQAREYYELNKKDFAKMIGLAPSTVGRYESGEYDIMMGTMMDIAEKLHISPAWFLGLVEDMYYEFDATYKKIPIINHVKKLPLMSAENYSGYEITRSDSTADFGVFMKDESMNKTFKQNSLVLFEMKDTAENGDIIAALDGESIDIRRYYKYGTQIVLREEGNKIIANEVDKVQIIGKAVSSSSEVE